MAKPATADSLFGYFATGLIVQAAGGFLLGLGLDADDSLMVLAGALALSIGGIITLIGTVAMGVLIGLRAHAHESARASA